MERPLTDPTSPAGPPTYPGARLGLPERGPGSVATWARRFAAITVDWAASLAVATAVLGTSVWGSGWQTWGPLAVFLAEATVLTALAGGSFGQLTTRMAVARLDRRPMTLGRAFLRSLLVCVVVPPLVFDRDCRGLHDLAAGTVTLRR